MTARLNAQRPSTGGRWTGRVGSRGFGTTESGGWSAIHDATTPEAGTTPDQPNRRKHMAALRLIVDPVPDASGFATIRQCDGSDVGDLDQNPIATVYDRSHAEAIACAVNHHDKLLECLRAFVSPWNGGGNWRSKITYDTFANARRVIESVELKSSDL